MEKIRHDAAYKAIFSHPEAVKSLLKGFVPDKFVAGFDFSTLKKCPNEYLGEDLRKRLNDCVWQVKWNDRDCYLLIMLEFQSGDDYWMPVRILIYTGLLWSDLIAHNQLKPGDRLPPVFPVVLYNGQKPWRGPTALKELIQQIHPALDDLQPNVVFRLVDEQRIPGAKLDEANGLAADIIRVEQARDPQDILNILLKMYHDSSLEAYQALFPTLATWFSAKIQKIAPGWSLSKEDGMTLMELLDKAMAPYEQGRKEGLASAIEILRNQLRTLLTTRFGNYPNTWEDLLEKVNDTSAIGRLLGLVYQVASAAEYEPALKAAATGNEGK